MFQKLRILTISFGLLTSSLGFASDSLMSFEPTITKSVPDRGRAVMGKVFRVCVHPAASSGSYYFAFRPDPQTDPDGNIFSGSELLWIHMNVATATAPQTLPYIMSVLNSGLTESLKVVVWFHIPGDSELHEVHGIRLTDIHY